MKGVLPVVLYVDNDADDTFLMERTVMRSDAGFCLCTANGVQTAINHVRNDHVVVPSLVILDYELDQGQATDFLTWLRGRPHWEAIPTMVLSGRDDEGCVARCYLAGAGSFVQKTVTLDELTKVVRAIELCVARPLVTLEPLKALKGYRTCRMHELGLELDRHRHQNTLLREETGRLRAELDIARAEAKESKRKYPYPKKRL